MFPHTAPVSGSAFAARQSARMLETQCELTVQPVTVALHPETDFRLFLRASLRRLPAERPLLASKWTLQIPGWALRTRSNLQFPPGPRRSGPRIAGLRLGSVPPATQCALRLRCSA